MEKTKCPEFIEGQVYKYALATHAKSLQEIDVPTLQEGQFGVYILQCADKSFYVGFSHNIHERIKKHKDGSGSKYTKKFKPKKLVYCEVYSHKEHALKREKQLKGWRREKKIELICSKMSG